MRTRFPTLWIFKRGPRWRFNGLIGPTDPTADYEIYWWVDFFNYPAIMTHDYADMVQVKFLEALPLLRTATGSSTTNHVDRVWMEVLLKSLGPDGLFYLPIEGRPWAWARPSWIPVIWRPDGSTTQSGDPRSSSCLTHSSAGDFWEP